ncbi:MAG: hypothetical protein AAFO99_03745 [Bacteroidota bacterium]
MAKMTVPKARNFGWELKPISSVYFKNIKNRSGQICVVLEHSLLRGVTTEMFFWWFKNFPNLQVTLDDIEGYEGQKVPAYYLWHPTDHISVRFLGKLGPGRTAKVGGKIHIQEAMQIEKYGLKYPVDSTMEIFYYAKDGWSMGRKIPFIGNLMALSIRFKDIVENGKIIGVHYHYEIVAGSNQKNALAKIINKKLLGSFGEQFWNAWLTHNTIEVGVFENFLPSLFEQRDDVNNLHYSKKMNPITESPSLLKGFDKDLFEQRIQGYGKSENAFDYQGALEKSFL